MTDTEVEEIKFVLDRQDPVTKAKIDLYKAMNKSHKESLKQKESKDLSTGDYTIFVTLILIAIFVFVCGIKNDHKNNEIQKSINQNLTFKNQHFKNDNYKNEIFRNYYMESCKYTNIVYENVDFENSVFVNFIFEETKFKNVNFKNCTFENVSFNNTQTKNMKFFDCQTKNISFDS